ncbi:MAG: SEC-C domain-containing protein [Pseudomonadales bacterium]|nr:SEC-C domain-containing protein [Pseudomonadales bacterium]
MADKFFFQGKLQKKPQQVGESFKTKRTTRPGSKEAPLKLTVVTQERQVEVQALVDERKLFATITLISDGQEDIAELNSLISTPKTIVLEKTPNRNDPCSCGSGKKYKKCCG